MGGQILGPGVSRGRPIKLRQASGEGNPQVTIGKALGAPAGANDVQASSQALWRLAVEVPHNLTETAANRVPHDRRPQLAGQGVAHMSRGERGVGQMPYPKRHVVDAKPIGSQSVECRASSETLNQADSLLRPRRRRAFMIARPPLVIIRCRNPCRRARRRTFG